MRTALLLLPALLGAPLHAQIQTLYDPGEDRTEVVAPNLWTKGISADGSTQLAFYPTASYAGRTAPTDPRAATFELTFEFRAPLVAGSSRPEHQYQDRSLQLSIDHSYQISAAATRFFTSTAGSLGTVRFIFRISLEDWNALIHGSQATGTIDGVPVDLSEGRIFETLREMGRRVGME